MKKLKLTIAFAALSFVAFGQTNLVPPVQIGSESPPASSILDVSSTSKGILIPRMTKVQRNAIISPVVGLLIYQTNGTPGFYYHTGSSWQPVKPDNNWSLIGNSGTDPATNFLGTTDTARLKFKVDGQLSGLITKADSNTTFGFKAGVSLTSGCKRNTFIGCGSGLGATDIGSDNTLIGFNSGNINGTGRNNTCVGSRAGENNTGGSNTFIGQESGTFNSAGRENTFVGQSAGRSNTVGISNVFIGTQSGFANQSGSNNVIIGFQTGDHNLVDNQTFVGFQAGFNNTTGGSNTFIGYQSGFFNTTGSSNTSTGFQALRNNETGSQNTASGYSALSSNTTGANNTATGFSALGSNTIGNSNTATGINALQFNTSGNSNTATGAGALNANITGEKNTATGATALLLNTTGNENTATGGEALYANTTGSQNTANGARALLNNSTGVSNTASGRASLESNNTGNYNTATGAGSLPNNTAGNDNTANGVEALRSNQSGNRNTASGKDALWSNSADDNTAFGFETARRNTTGTQNTAIGIEALIRNETGNYNTAVGAGAGTSGTDFKYTTALGAHARTSASYQIRIGNDSILSIGGVVDWSVMSDERVKENIKKDVPGLKFISKLQPVTYSLNLNAIDQVIKNGTAQNHDTRSMEGGQGKIYSGFIAQEVEKAAKELNFDFSGIDPAKNDNDLYGLRYAQFVVPLVKAVQELDSINNSKSHQIETLQSELEQVKQDLQELGQSFAQRCPNYQSPNVNRIFSIADVPKLEQNVPNPFNQKTTIKVYLPGSVNAATIRIYSLDGVEMKTFDVSRTGYSEISLAGNSLASGVYVYTLITDGIAIDTKQMILTK